MAKPDRLPLRLFITVLIGLTATTAALPAFADAAFPGRNGKIAFSRLLDNGDGTQGSVRDVFVANADGSGEVNLTNRPAAEESPAWSPDGARIAYMHWNGTYVMNADGSDRNLRTVGGPPGWSPDGGKLVVGRQTHQYWPYNSDIYTVNEDGSELFNLIQDPREGPWDAHPVWSPRGTKIAFVSERADARRHEVYTVNPDGTGLKRITYAGGDWPDWSPDGAKILFSRRGQYLSQGSDLYTVNADGTGERRLTSNTTSEFMAVWSPDGTQILFNRDTGDSRDIWVMNADGTGERRIIVDGEGPDWQPIVNHPPECGAVLAEPGDLAKVNRLLVPVELTGISDPDGDAITLRVEAVTQDEPLTAPGDDTAPDAVRGAEPGAVSLRAERNPHGDGRIYKIDFAATDPDGASCTGVAAVSVQRRKDTAPVDSAPPSYDSFGS